MFIHILFFEQTFTHLSTAGSPPEKAPAAAPAAKLDAPAAASDAPSPAKPAEGVAAPSASHGKLVSLSLSLYVRVCVFVLPCVCMFIRSYILFFEH